MSKSIENERDIVDSLFSFNPEEKESEFYKLFQMFVSTEDIELKTELEDPLTWSGLQIYSDFLEEKKLKRSSERVRSFVFNSMKNLVSKNRKGREEYGNALKRSIIRMDEMEVKE